MPFLQVLAEAGPDGLALGEVVRRINAAGLRDLRSSRNPEASVGGALARDVIFWKVAPARFALHAVVAFHRCGVWAFSLLGRLRSRNRGPGGCAGPQS